MPESPKDHTQSLVPYQAILEGCEEDYRTTLPASRDAVIDSIIEQIRQAATEAKARVANDENLWKVCIATTFCQY